MTEEPKEEGTLSRGTWFAYLGIAIATGHYNTDISTADWIALGALGLLILWLTSGPRRKSGDEVSNQKALRFGQFCKRTLSRLKRLFIAA